MPPRRILIIGSSGSGKSTLAARVAEQLGLPYVSTDALFWTADWKPVSGEALRSWAAEMAARDSWVLDGNFHGHRDLLWTRAELAVWLDLPRWTSFTRVVGRNLKWWLSRRPVWGIGPLPLARALGGMRHAWRSPEEKTRAFPDALATLADAQVVRLRSRREIEVWLAELDSPLVPANAGTQMT